MWTPLSDQPDFHHARMDGVANFGATVVAFGRDLDGRTIVVWTSDDVATWRWATVDANAAPGSRIRAIATDGRTTAAVGIDTAHDGTAVWTSEDTRRWRKTIVGDAAEQPAPDAEPDPAHPESYSTSSLMRTG